MLLAEICCRVNYLCHGLRILCVGTLSSILNLATPYRIRRNSYKTVGCKEVNNVNNSGLINSMYILTT